MESLWPNDIADSIPWSELRDFVFLKKKPDFTIFRATLASSGTRVTVKILTATSADLRERFVQEAALFKLLEHKNIPGFVGVSTVPPSFSELKESKDRSLAAFIIRQPQGKELSSYLHEALSPKKQKKKQRRAYYDGLLDVLIDVADALHYLHTRRPAVIYRAVSMGHITVVESESGIRGSLTNLNCVVLHAENKRKTRVGIETFAAEAINSEAMLTCDFFKETLMCTSSGAVSPRKSPQIPLESSSITQKSQKKTTTMRSSSAKATIPTRPSRKGKKAIYNKPPVAVKKGKQDSIKKLHKSESVMDIELPHVKDAQETKDKAIEVICQPMQPMKIVDAILEECVFPSPTSAYSFEQSTKKTQSAFHEDILDSPATNPLATPTSVDVKLSAMNLRHLRGHDSASSSKWSDNAQSCENLDPAEKGIEKSRTQISTDSAIADFSKGLTDSTTFSEEEDVLQREDSIQFLRRTVGESNLSPEMLVGEISGIPGDVFSFGLVIYGCLSRMAPIPLSTKPGHLQFTFQPDFPDTIKDLIMDCCKKKPELRPSMDKVKDRLQDIKASGCLHNIRHKTHRRFGRCFGRF